MSQTGKIKQVRLILQAQLTARGRAGAIRAFVRSGFASIGGLVVSQGSNLVVLIDTASFVAADVITLFLSLRGRAAP